MGKSIKGDKYLDYSGKTLERRPNFTAVSVHAFAFLNGRVQTVDKEFDCLQEQGGQVCSSRLWRYGEQCMHVQCLDTFLFNFRMYPSCS